MFASTGVECGRKNPFDEFANVRRVRAEHFASLKHHLEVLLRHNVVMKYRLKKCSNLEPKPLDNHRHSHENFDHQNSQEVGGVEKEETNDRKGSDISDDDRKDNIVKDSYLSLKSNGVTKNDHTPENVSAFSNGNQNQHTSKNSCLLEDIEVGISEVISALCDSDFLLMKQILLTLAPSSS